MKTNEDTELNVRSATLPILSSAAQIADVCTIAQAFGDCFAFVATSFSSPSMTYVGIKRQRPR
jgi:hypothetical protein